MEYEGTTYGYARVSSRDQNLARQLFALREYPIDDHLIFTDKASGKNFDRPGYQQLIDALKPGDLVVIKSIDRLGRDYDDIRDQWHLITRDAGADIAVLDMPLLDTRNAQAGLTGVFISDMVLQVLSYVAQTERDEIKQRQAEGIAAAQSRGVRFGRPSLPIPEDFQEVYQAYRQGLMTVADCTRKLNVCRQTFYKWCNQFESCN